MSGQFGCHLIMLDPMAGLARSSLHSKRSCNKREEMLRQNSRKMKFGKAPVPDIHRRAFKSLLCGQSSISLRLRQGLLHR
ncbi:hypothetical protein [Nereida sp. MMG025]|uniref:hypothetical protein n=1 Tax=Nereida sp. MMG025 TaxID=2909981 RepID=UPI001F25E84B|nr:hypothetical protein [Nereida sp. MMG025]MCF6446120.1 hypothetical protein [Nereida sp. MMG025]